MASAASLLRAPLDIANPAAQASRALASPAAQTAKAAAPKVLVVRAQSNAESAQSRRSVLSLLAASAVQTFVAQANAVSDIKVEGPPPPSGGLPGTKSADQARDFDAPLKERFYLQPLPPAEALARAKESADQIIAVKPLIDRKAWPYVQNDLRSKGSYLRFDLSTVIGSKPKPEKKALTDLSNKLYDAIAKLDYAARSKSPPAAEKSYDETVALLKEIFAKLG